MRPATKEDLYRVQQENAATFVWDFDVTPTKPAPGIIHKGCGGRLSVQSGVQDRYACNGVSKTFGKCPWLFRCSLVHSWTDEVIGKLFEIEIPPDPAVYRLEQVVGKGRDPSYYRTRPASWEEAREYAKGTADPWKLG